MKTLKIITGLLFFAILISCSSDSGAASTDPVQGQWKLVNVSGTFAGINNNFPPGQITWHFNSITQTVTVINNNTDPNKWDVLETGVYNYQIIINPEPSSCSEIIKINGGDMGCFTVSDNTLLIDQSIADGFAVTLKH
ncbi:hypothetical protein [Flavobacterium sp.]|uniref:hypothetical protein n=1 Tax=Flavobacterium sp. TaxID=239 RepID=UPI002FDB5D98